MRARYIDPGANDPQATEAMETAAVPQWGGKSVPPNTKGWVKKSSLQRRLKGDIQKTRGIHGLRSRERGACPRKGHSQQR